MTPIPDPDHPRLVFTNPNLPLGGAYRHEEGCDQSTHQPGPWPCPPPSALERRLRAVEQWIAREEEWRAEQLERGENS